MSSDHLRAVSSRLREVMALLDLEPVAVARLLGVTTSKLGNWLGARNYPDEYLMTVFCDRYGVTMDYLYRGVLFGLQGAVADGLARARTASEEAVSRDSRLALGMEGGQEGLKQAAQSP